MHCREEQKFYYQGFEGCSPCSETSSLSFVALFFLNSSTPRSSFFQSLVGTRNSPVHVIRRKRTPRTGCGRRTWTLVRANRTQTQNHFWDNSINEICSASRYYLHGIVAKLRAQDLIIKYRDKKLFSWQIFVRFTAKA